MARKSTPGTIFINDEIPTISTERPNLVPRVLKRRDPGNEVVERPKRTENLREESVKKLGTHPRGRRGR